MQNFLGFGPQPAIEVDFGGGDRRHVTVKGDHANTTETVPLFSGTETINGQVRASFDSSVRAPIVLRHEGIPERVRG